jgi:hypothetical protein
MSNKVLPRASRLVLHVCFGVTLLAGVLPAMSGCARAQAKASPDGPPLDVPAPPPRVIAPSDEPIVVAPAEPTEPAPAPASTTRRPTRRPAQSNENTQKPVDVAPPVEAPLPQAVPEPANASPPAPTLRAPGTAEKPVRDRLTEAQRDLARVDYAKLSTDGRMQYEQSKRFVQQAEQALKDQNFVFAQTLADKAATLAAELLGR